MNKSLKQHPSCCIVHTFPSPPPTPSLGLVREATWIEIFRVYLSFWRCCVQLFFRARGPLRDLGGDTARTLAVHRSLPCVCMYVQLCPALCDPREWSPPGSSVHWILQARILVWVAIFFSRGSSGPRDQTQVSCIAGRFFTTEPPGKPPLQIIKCQLSHYLTLQS